MYLLVLEASTIEDSFSQAFEAAGFDPGLLSGGDSAIFGDWEAYSKNDAAGISYAVASQIVGENAYVLMVKADKPGVSPENGAVMRVMNSLKIAGKEEMAIESYVVDHLLTPLAMESTHFQPVEADERYAKGQYPADQTEELVAKLNEYRGPGQEDLVLQKGESFSTLDDFRVLPPWGGLFGTPSDVTHFLQMYLNGGRFGEIQILQPETVAAMQEMQTSTDGSPLGFGLSWWIGKDDFGKFIYHGGGGHTIETTMHFYPDLDLGVVVMGSVNGYGSERIAEGLVSAWMNEK